MTFDTAMSTSWPAGLALLLLLVALINARRHFVLPQAWVAVAAAALFVRLVVIPALSDHIYDGHEADYFDLFVGSREPTRGGTVMVPGMQWLWWGLGQVLPSWSWIPVVLVAIVATAAIGLLAGAVGTLAGRPAGWAAAMVLVLHPTHAAWSSSAYNVMIPHALGCLALYAAARIAVRAGPPGGLPWVVAGAASLMVALRLDTATLVWPLVLLPLVVRPHGVTLGRRLISLTPAGLVGAALAGLAAWPLVWPGELPGAGERAISFEINLGLLDYYTPFDGPVGLAVVIVAAILVIRRWPGPSIALVPLAIGHHLLLTTFDDFGGRHTLPTLIPIVWCLGASVVASRRIGWLLVGISILLGVHQVQDLASRYYGSEPAFEAVLLQPPWAELPRVQWPGGVDPACGWVAEDHRVRRGPVASHFNLIRPQEEASLRGPNGCLRWCLDVQDWRWSSRGIRDRAIRLEHMFVLTPAFVVEEPSTGYACLAMDVGLRRSRSTPTGPDTRGAHESLRTTHRSDSPIP